MDTTNNKPARYLIIPLTVILLLLLPVVPGFAQGQAVISAVVDKTTLTTDEILTLTVTVNANQPGLPGPDLPDLSGLRIVGNSSSSQISIINGNVQAQLMYVYQLQPYEVGDLTIESLSVTLDGQTFNTQPISIHVEQGTGAPAKAPSSHSLAPNTQDLLGQDGYVEAEVDNLTPFLGQQVVYTFRFYDNGLTWFDQPHYEAPDFSGFWTENQTDQTQYQVQASGQIYNVTELHTVLFPSMVGQIPIEPARLTTRGGFFSSGTDLRTQAITLDVQPLPDNAPAGFNGAVGQFELDAQVDTNQARVNEPVTWKVTLSGQGNLNTLPDPTWPELDEFRSYESQATINTQFQDGQVVGSRVYERLLVPQVEGDLTIPGLEYTFFNPTSGTYETIQTQAIQISVAPGDDLTARGVTPVPGGGKETVEQIATDIRYLKHLPSRLSTENRPVTSSALYWLAWGIPVLGLIGNVVWQRRQRYWQNNANLARSSRARRKARQAMAQARKTRGDVYSDGAQVLFDYLADKLGQPVAGLTHHALTGVLHDSGVSPELSERVSTCLMEAELGRYSPEAGDPHHADNLLREIDAVMDSLEKVL